MAVGFYPVECTPQNGIASNGRDQETQYRTTDLDLVRPSTFPIDQIGFLEALQPLPTCATFEHCPVGDLHPLPRGTNARLASGLRDVGFSAQEMPWMRWHSSTSTTASRRTKELHSEDRSAGRWSQRVTEIAQQKHTHNVLPNSCAHAYRFSPKNQGPSKVKVLRIQTPAQDQNPPEVVGSNDS